MEGEKEWKIGGEIEGLPTFGQYKQYLTKEWATREASQRRN